MAGLAEQLKSVKLRTSEEPTRDFSSPKTAGFMTDSEVRDYQEKVLDVNTEQWLPMLEADTFPTKYCPMSLPQAKLFISLYQRLYQNLDPTAVAALDWRETLSEEEKGLVEEMEKNLQEVMNRFLNDGSDYTFVKTSCRSAKDAPLTQSRFSDMYRQLLEEEEEGKRGEENTQIKCLLTAAFRAMRVREAGEVLDMMIRSERVFQDMTLAIEFPDRFSENFVVRNFVNIDVDMEFRGFVYGGRLVALSQYNYLIFSQRLVESKDAVAARIEAFYNDKVKPKLEGHKFVDNFIIDFAIASEDDRIWVIEINPFLVTTDAALFSWEHERHLLEGKGEGLQFRLTLKPRPGSKAMLPHSVKMLMG